LFVRYAYTATSGGNKGIGLAICAALLKSSPTAFVYLGSRDAARGRAAVASLEEADASARGRVKALQVDVCDRGSLVAAADAVRKVRRRRAWQACLRQPIMVSLESPSLRAHNQPV